MHAVATFMEHLIWMGLVFGLIGFLYFRERNRHRTYLAQLDRMPPEQWGALRRAEVEAEIEQKRQSLGNIWLLRTTMFVLGGVIGLLIGLLIYYHCVSTEAGNRTLDIVYPLIFVLSLFGATLFLLLEFVIEVVWKRRMQRTIDNKANGLKSSESDTATA